MSSNLLIYSIVIPLYNESHTISITLKRIGDYLCTAGIEYELILVDDGSTDNTVEKIEYAIRDNPRIRLLKNADNEGKGAAVRKGALNSQGDYIVFMDADLSISIEAVGKVAEAVAVESDTIFIGARDKIVRDAKMIRTYIRRFISRIYNFTANLLFNLHIKDVGCGFKCFPVKVAQKIFQRQYIKGWVFDVEVLLRARRSGVKIKEIPVSWTNLLPTHVNIITDSLYCFFDLMKLFFLNLFKKL